MKQEDPNQILNDVTSNDYKYGFVTDIETEVIPTGLCKNVIRLISTKKRRTRMASRIQTKGL